MRVLHVLRQLNPGGIECWLDRLVRCWPAQSRPEFHFALECEDFGMMAPALVREGVYLHHTPPPTVYDSARRFRHLLNTEGPFDVVHCHNHHAASFHLSLAAMDRVPVRIAHSHADFRLHPRRQSKARRLYEFTARKVLLAAATVRLAVGNGAACDLYENAVARFLPCGSNFTAFLDQPRRIPEACFNLVHVGRLVPEKNHEFLFRVFAALESQLPQARLHLVGDGPLRAALESEAAALGLRDKIHFHGNALDVPEILAGCHAFVFPSHSEGLGLAAIEAQAAGLPLLLASHLPAEIDVLPHHCRRLALDVPLSEWVSALLEMQYFAAQPASIRRDVLEQSPYSIASNIAALGDIYAGR